MTSLRPLDQFDPARADISPILMRLAGNRRKPSELKGIAAAIPEQSVLPESSANAVAREGQGDLDVSRLTATRYLDALAAERFMRKNKVSPNNDYVNVALNAFLPDAQATAGGGAGRGVNPVVCFASLETRPKGIPVG